MFNNFRAQRGLSNTPEYNERSHLLLAFIFSLQETVSVATLASNVPQKHC